MVMQAYMWLCMVIYIVMCDYRMLYMVIACYI